MLAALLFLLAPLDIGIEKDGVVHLTAEEAADLLTMDPNIAVLDVRTRNEFRAGHIDGAVQINYFTPSFRKQLENADFSGPVLVHCKSGGRSGRTVRILKDLGAETIYHLDGGIVAWKRAGLPTVTADEEATE